jgi:antirestriction protein ArdC
MAKFKKKFTPITEQEHIDRVCKPILDSMEKGQVPWHKPWDVSLNAQGNLVAGVQKSLSSGKLYEGFNSLILSIIANQEQYKNQYWGTYLGIKKSGGQIRKGEKGVYVLKWDFIPVVKGQDDCTKCKGAIVYVKGKKQPCTKCESEKIRTSIKMYSSAVWNLDQADWADGVPEKFRPAKPKKVKKPTKKEEQARINRVCKEAQKVIDAYIPQLRGGLTDEKIESNDAYYSPSRDAIVVPAKKQYPRIESYYRVAFHEMVHSTGHKSRLKRFKEYSNHMHGSADYSKEEFVAEIGACVLSSFFGTETSVDLENSGAYLRSWKKGLANNKKDIVFAIGQAMKAVNFIVTGDKK